MSADERLSEDVQRLIVAGEIAERIIGLVRVMVRGEIAKALKTQEGADQQEPACPMCGGPKGEPWCGIKTSADNHAVDPEICSPCRDPWHDHPTEADRQGVDQEAVRAARVADAMVEAAMREMFEVGFGTGSGLGHYRVNTKTVRAAILAALDAQEAGS